MQESINGNLTRNHYLSSPPIEPSFKEFLFPLKLQGTRTGNRTRAAELRDKEESMREGVYHIKYLFNIRMNTTVSSHSWPPSLLIASAILFERTWTANLTFIRPFGVR